MTAAVMTYDSLVTDIIGYAERYDDTSFAAQVPRFVMLAENRIASEVRGLGLLKIVSGSLTSSDPELAKPSRWRETASFRITSGTSQVTLFERSHEYCRYYWPNTATTGTPRYYSDYGYEHFFIVPSPSSAFVFELMYYERPEPLSALQETSWTTQYAPQLILYASLLEAALYLKYDSDTLARYQGFYAQAVAAVGAEAKRRAFDRSTAMRE